MKQIKIKCPAKINLTLEVVNRRDDGYHNINSVMQLVDLYDYLTITIGHADSNTIKLSGNSNEIPYDKTNLVYKACELFLKESQINEGANGIEINIDIDKHIPISAGLAGGSTDGAGTIYGLNKLFNAFDEKGLHNLCSKLGSDLNVCLLGGCVLATSRGEITEPLKTVEKNVTLIKPKYLGISAKEAYTKYALKKDKPQNKMTKKMIEALKNNDDIEPFLYNDLEYAVFDDYQQLQEIKKAYPNAIMSGSGSTYFVLDNVTQLLPEEGYLFMNNLKFIQEGVSVV